MKFTEEHKRKISETMKGKPKSDSTKEKLRIANLGKKASLETKKRMSETRKRLGIRPPSAKGRIISKETRRKLSEIHRGEKSYNWKGGISILGHTIRTCFKYRQWRSDIYTRDNFTCVLCGKRTKKGERIEINADHYPKGFAEILSQYNIKTLEQALECEELWNLNNGRTLCTPCHIKRKNHGKKHNQK